jgi:hypothetical protein
VTRSPIPNLALLATLAAILPVAGTVAAAPPAELLRTIREVGSEGRGHAAAQTAWKELSRLDARALPEVLVGFQDANPLAANWIRSAFETIADRTLRTGGKLPTRELEAYALDRAQNPAARRLAYEWLLKVDASAQARLVPGMLDDPSAEFRRDAVALHLKQAQQFDEKKQAEQAVAEYRKALRGAVHDDQVKQIVAALKKHEVEVDLQRHFGFLTQWQMIGPFDNKDEKGFPVVYPPEEKLDLQAKYPGQKGEVSWKPASTQDDYGILDVAKVYENFKGSAMYATTRYVADRDRNVEIRLGTPNAWKLWVNGELLFAREEYHRGMRLDQYRVKARLKSGENVLLLKILQNEQEQEWAQDYKFQLRVCDGAGSAIPSAGPVRTGAAGGSSAVRSVAR